MRIIWTFDTVDDDVLAYGEAPRPDAEMFIAAAVDERERGERKETGR